MQIFPKIALGLQESCINTLANMYSLNASVCSELLIPSFPLNQSRRATVLCNLQQHDCMITCSHALLKAENCLGNLCHSAAAAVVSTALQCPTCSPVQGTIIYRIMLHSIYCQWINMCACSLCVVCHSTTPMSSPASSGTAQCRQ